ncbi:helix-turn-helix domain-containing protein [Vreelandella titanicae]|uniref:Helix-turn-helix transcriptional regulator n=1 Tax=Vreelandella titanicae TaxID=664683 RepID=A0A558JF55_9GAMM|nr:AraC family transcriptional regulator [Halomonas titanicae]TVU92259.1 helix-turn-helix transcriptional regulator [Halomonas titanicae]|tara:strand:+ start:7850 stop:8761 length:912 start_codon:yes stop_codon:yes gene_type:complete
MQPALLTPDKMLDVIPGRVTCLGTVGNNRDLPVSFRGYQFDKTEVNIPSLRDYKLVKWNKGSDNLGFYENGVWRKSHVAEGNITLLSRGEETRWYWMNDIEVSHVYISHGLINKIANETFDRDIDDFSIKHHPVVNDSSLSRIIELYEQECSNGKVGSDIYLQTLEVQMCIHLIRNYAQFTVKDVGLTSRLSSRKKKLLEEYIEENLSTSLSVQKLSGLVGLSQSHFIRVFSSDYGCSPHHYVQYRRLRRAQLLLSSSSDYPIKAIAIECGFSDQSHLTRALKSKLSLTPGQYRSQCFIKMTR